jgi:hypothetical protein
MGIAEVQHNVLGAMVISELAAKRLVNVFLGQRACNERTNLPTTGKR